MNSTRRKKSRYVNKKEKKEDTKKEEEKIEELFLISRAKVDLDSPLLSPPLHQPPSTKKQQRPEERADNETRPMEKRTHLGDGLVLELTGSLGELRELGSL